MPCGNWKQILPVSSPAPTPSPLPEIFHVQGASALEPTSFEALDFGVFSPPFPSFSNVSPSLCRPSSQALRTRRATVALFSMGSYSEVRWGEKKSLSSGLVLCLFSSSLSGLPSTPGSPQSPGPLWRLNRRAPGIPICQQKSRTRCEAKRWLD